MYDMTLWRLLANALLVMGIVSCYGKVRSSLLPVRIPLQPARYGQNRSR